MTKLHQLLAAEPTAKTTATKLIAETVEKFHKKDQYFQGHDKTYTPLVENTDNEAVAAARRDRKELITTVRDTLEYTLNAWAESENLQMRKNVTNMSACSHLEFRGETIATTVPIYELMGLDARLQEIRGMLLQVPTRDASKQWVVDADAATSSYRLLMPEVTLDTVDEIYGVTLAPATDKHPAQIKEAKRTKTVGKYTKMQWSGAASANQKAEALAVVDELMVEVAKARQRCNEQVASEMAEPIGTTITKLILKAF